MGLDDLVRAVTSGDALGARQWVVDHADIDWSRVPQPSFTSQRDLAIAAGLAELLASRAGKPPPPWAASVGPADEDIHLVRATATLPRFRRRVEAESPEPLRSRRIFAPANYLTAA